MPNFLHRPDGAAYLWKRRLQGAVRVLVASDFDGTLSETVLRPDLAVPLPAALPALAALAAHAAFRVAIVSGRSLEDLRRRCPAPGCLYLGSHGNEFSGGRWLPPALAARRAGFARRVAEVAAAARSQFGDLPGARLEIKPFSVTLHFRAAPALEPRLHAFAARLAEAGDLRLLPARRALELMPAGLLDKGEAVVRLRRRLGCDLAFYFGDDRSDEDVFARQDRGLIGVQVEHGEMAGAPRVAPDYTLAGPAQVVLALRELAKYGPCGSEKNERFSAGRSKL